MSNSSNTNTQNTKQTKPKKPNNGRGASKSVIYTHTGHKLTVKEAKFIDKFIELGNQSQAVIEAGYKTSCPARDGGHLYQKPYIAEEISYRMNQMQQDSIATAEEVMKYFTSVMRGDIQDQFGLEAPLSERTKAAQELAKRQIDIPNKLKGVEQANEVHIVLDW